MLLANRRGLNLFIPDLELTRVLFKGSLHNRRSYEPGETNVAFCASRASRKMPRSPRFAHKAPVMQANPRWRPLRCWERALFYESLSRDQAQPFNRLRVISIKILHVISMLYKTDWWWELRTWSHKIQWVDTSATSHYYFYRKHIGTANRNLNFNIRA